MIFNAYQQYKSKPTADRDGHRERKKKPEEKILSLCDYLLKKMQFSTLNIKKNSTWIQVKTWGCPSLNCNYSYFSQDNVIKTEIQSCSPGLQSRCWNNGP